MKIEGVYLIDKEPSWTSFDVVAKMRGITGIKKIGHAGTLDPFATGLLVVLVGKESTKKQDSFMKQDKEYEAVLELGKVSTTFDTEGEISKTTGNSPIDREIIEKALGKFIGEIEQVPPIYSAIKVNGKRAYNLAREGAEFQLKSRKVNIYDIQILEYNWPFLKLNIKCGSGTYIRSLANDIGKILGVGSYLKELRRTKIGEFKVEDATKITELNFSSK